MRAVQAYNTEIRTFPSVIGARVIYGASRWCPIQADEAAPARADGQFRQQPVAAGARGVRTPASCWRRWPCSPPAAAPAAPTDGGRRPSRRRECRSRR